MTLAAEFRINNLNPIHIRRLEETGVELKRFKTKAEQIGISKKNPIEVLFDHKKLDRKQFAAARYYQKQFDLSNISHHARPSYDGTPISAASSQLNEGGPKQMQLEASAFIFRIKTEIQLINHETQFLNKKFQVVDLRLPEILERVFEKQQKFLYVQTAMRISRGTLQKRIKDICDFLLEC